MTIGHMIDGIMEAEITAHAMQADAFVGEPIYEPGPVLPEDPIPTIPLPEIPAQEAEPEDPPVFDISSDEEEPEPELEHAGWLEDEEDFEDDPEEI
ncbi:hypothetical protein TIFTF001_038060 [Ficus carica]|uniref:Uncharacterized protein n=1 Tax=Ficus carica TaxID=3494 RepID=A0AA88E6R2_FICCA|nr:hypothetical protein TIFTF001_038055 [Ficus carica]GMN69009.1 hypothetical protein TIFTF001_038060 [Ficus carica]